METKSVREKQTLSIRINTQLYQQLKSEIGKGKISEFVEKTLTEKLSQKEQELELVYQEIAQDKNRWKLTKEWEKVALSDLRKKVK